MALKTERLTINKKTFTVLYSDKGMYIRETDTDRLYKKVGLRISKHRYEETDIPIPVKENNVKEEITKEE